MKFDIICKIIECRNNPKVLAVAIVYEVVRSHEPKGRAPKGLKNELKRLVGVTIQTNMLRKIKNAKKG